MIITFKTTLSPSFVLFAIFLFVSAFIDNECFDPFSVGFGDFRGLLGDPSMFDPELYPELADDLYFDFPGPTPAQSVPFLPASSSRFNNNRHPSHLNHHQPQTVRSSAIIE